MASIPGLGPVTAAPPSLAGERVTARAQARQRLAFLIMLFPLLALLILARLIELTVIEGAPASEAEPITAAPPRGDIVDRNGVELARTFEAYAITVMPRRLTSDPEVLASKLAEILPERSREDILADLTSRKSFRYLARRVLPGQAQRINELGEPAIELAREAERLYPNMTLAAQALGYTGDGGGGAVRGLIGVEKAFDATLSDPVQRAAPLALSLDVRVQQAMQNELAALVADQNAKGAAGVVLDVNTGEVLAMVSLPDFNPNAPGQRADGTRYTTENDDGSRFNRVTLGGYELGSTFKAFTIATALETGVLTNLQKQYDATRPLELAGFRIRDDHAKNRWLTVPEIFIYSSNIGTARMALELGRERQRAYLEKLGFLKPLEFELQEKTRPQYPPLSNWGQLATMTISYGHGLTVSPLHLANGYATLVNGGLYRPPTILKRDSAHVPPGTRVFSERTSLEVRRLLRLVVTKGTGRKADVPGYRVGGKTGTAEKIENGRYVRGQNVVNFAAVFPVDAPRYVVVAMIDDPRGSKATYGFRTAGMVVAPAINRIIRRIAPPLGVLPDETRDLDLAGLLPSKAAAEE
ncbi:peptidoglycan D,D-transpeptidase FtsI family protein [Sandarakinorhabdus rubra]|uniref:peptidoglycan D,D-transpeptidase FtsI family protein n=1 Tax=Sandarakinorhabdus rubra TaxID=2672568 RepID=UPI0013D9044F|nr:penicillin-binding protein 2 [Sandarakinorhabdus rubra]